MAKRNTTTRRNIVIVCVDCLRWDAWNAKLRRGGYLSRTLQARGESVPWAFTTAPWTLPATNSLLTGLYPHRHGARHEGHYRRGVDSPWPAPLRRGLPTIFTEFKKHGYLTVGISTIYWALCELCCYDACDVVVRSERQNVFYTNVRAAWAIDQLAAVLGTTDPRVPFCAYLHLCDLHRPLDLELAMEFAGEPFSNAEGLQDWDVRAHQDNPRALCAFMQARWRAYCALLDYIETEIERMMLVLSQHCGQGNTTVVITADHGEEFGEHLKFEAQHFDCGKKTSESPWLLGTGHGHTLFNELVRVPLAVIDAGVALADGWQHRAASLIDLLPTALGLVGYEEHQLAAIDGASLLLPPPARDLLVESTLYGFERKGLIRWPYKYVYSPFEDHVATHDLANDPADDSPRIGVVDPDALSQLHRLYANEPVDAGIGR